MEDFEPAREQSQELPPVFGPFARLDGPPMPTQGTFQKGCPEGAIIHFTAGRFEKGLADAIATAKFGATKGYSFWLISRDGTVLKTHPLNRWGYHAGVSEHRLLGKSVSKKTLGIELTCGGKLTRKNLKSGPVFKTWYGLTIPREQVRYIALPRYHGEETGYYHIASPEQENSLVELLLELKKFSPEIFSFEKVLGHDEVSPGRKNDPGGALSVGMPSFRKLLAREAAKRGIKA